MVKQFRCFSVDDVSLVCNQGNVDEDDENAEEAVYPVQLPLSKHAMQFRMDKSLLKDPLDFKGDTVFH